MNSQAGTRFIVDHTAGGRHRETAAVDGNGRVVLRIKGDWAILDEQGRWTLYNTPDMLATAKAKLIDGLLGGLLGTTANASTATGRNAGPGHETVRRALLPAKGPSPRPQEMAAVDREPANPHEPGHYRVTWTSGGDPGMTFVPMADPTATRESTGFADPRFAAYELRQADGRPVIRHTAQISKDFNLERSIFEVLDPAFPLDEAVILCLARFHAWRS